MMRTLDNEVFEAFKVPPKRFTRFLLELHDVLPNENGLMNWIEFLQEDLDEPSQDVIELAAKLYSHFLAKSLRVKGTNLNLIASSARCGIFIIKHTSSNSLMKK